MNDTTENDFAFQSIHRSLDDEERENYLHGIANKIDLKEDDDYIIKKEQEGTFVNCIVCFKTSEMMDDFGEIWEFFQNKKMRKKVADKYGLSMATVRKVESESEEAYLQLMQLVNLDE
jgi:ABC-type metal ion transport system substrate-binding protein